MLERNHATNATALHLAGTLAARICHDLAGTLGALCATLEMAENDPEALALARDLATDMAARLKLIRAAWGEGAETPALASLAPGLPHAERIGLTAGDSALDGPTRRLAACLLIEASAGLPRGGTITLAGDTNQFSITIEGPRAAWPAFAPPSTPRNADAAMARSLADELGFLLVSDTSTQLTCRKQCLLF